jgi:hypothetical protein
VYSGSHYEPVPGDRTALVVLDRKEEVDREDARVSTEPDMEEIQARNPSPTEWLRLPVENEDPGFSNLKDPLVVMQSTDKEGGRVTLSGDYNPIFVPFDLTHPEWYYVYDADGTELARDPGDVANLLAFDPEGHYRLYLRPANWRWVATVVAHYVYISWFEAFYSDLIFTEAYYNRPPVYPKRHDLLNDVPSITVNGVDHCFSAAINESFEKSEAAAFLAQQMMEAQWWTLSEAFVYVGNDPPSVAISLYPPQQGDMVLGVGRVDYPGGAEEVLWVKQVVTGDTAGWTPQFLQYYLVPWYATV